jgi:predicted Zn finger-like uncharacterized protein
LYTQCPDCGTVFRVTADALRVAQGDVRCGICSTRFNALESLRDEPRTLLEDQSPEDTITVEELPGNEMIELSSPEAEEGSGPVADEPLEGSPAQDEAGPRQDAEPSDEPAPEALEFHGGDEDLERVFMLAGAETAAGRGESPPSAEAGDEAGDARLLAAFEQASLADLSGIEVHEEHADVEPFTGGDDLGRTDEFPIVELGEAASDERLPARNRSLGRPRTRRRPAPRPRPPRRKKEHQATAQSPSPPLSPASSFPRS